MTPNAIIKNFDVFKNTRTSFGLIRVVVLMHEFLLQRREETFRHRVVSAVTLATHAAVDAVASQRRSKGLTANGLPRSEW